VGFGVSRLATHLNKKLYDGRWLYHEAQKIDSRPGENYVGTTVRAGLDVLRKRGHRVMGPDGVAARPDINEGSSPTAGRRTSRTSCGSSATRAWTTWTS
jgi:hypothetical protein